jgi:hypothetical protein
MRRVAVVLLCLLAGSCALPPRIADPSRSGVWGYLTLVPHEGAAPAGATPYGDRRYADAELVDYSKPGFAVVYVEDGAPPAAPAGVAIRAGRAGARLDPAHAAVAVGSELRVANETGEPHVVSCPEAGVLQRLAPGESVGIRAARAGELSLFVPDAPGAASRAFVAPGPFAIVSATGRYELLDVAPGSHRLRAWHPRFPPGERRIELAPGRVERVDLALGVGLAEAGDGAQ